MISTFDIFKIILGIIISAFILFLALRFVGSYTQIGESGRDVSIILNFKKTMEKVYATGISSDFEIKDSKAIIGYRPPYIETTVSFVDTSPMPVLIVQGEKLSVNRVEYDVGWWKFYMVEALPETKIIFVPLNGDERSWSLIRNVTTMLPSTENTNVKTMVGVGCNSSEFWFGWERGRFLDSILPRLSTQELGLNLCGNTAYFKEKGFMLVTVSGKPEDADFVVIPSDEGIGAVMIRNGDAQDKYVYKNGLDIVALLLGGASYYNYTNHKFLGELEVAIDVSSREYALLMSDPGFNKRCGTASLDFVGVLGAIKELIPKVGGNPAEADARDFVQLMAVSAGKYRNLESVGCAS
jgi:hypothetical protein